MYKFVKFFFAFFIGTILWVFFNGFLIHRYSKHYFEVKSDVAIVLGAGTSQGKISSVFVERLKHAANLLNSKKVNYIIITGGYGEGQTISDSQAAKNYLIQQGIPEKYILIEEKSKITFYNLVYAKRIMDLNGLQTALIISDPYHMKRSMLMSNKVGIEGLPSPTPTSMYRSPAVKRKFLFNQAYNLCVYQIFGRFRSNKSSESE